MVKVRFSASGYGTTVKSYKTREAAECAVADDAAGVAAEHGGRVANYGDEWVAETNSGEEIARWEIV